MRGLILRRPAAAVRTSDASTTRRPMRRLLSLTLVSVVVAGCGGTSADDLDPTPERKDGSSSLEFEREDLERAAGASDRVKEYCAGAVSEAQRIGCESHVTEEDIP
jgi:hypothetical protein